MDESNSKFNLIKFDIAIGLFSKSAFLLCHKMFNNLDLSESIRLLKCFRRISRRGMGIIWHGILIIIFYTLWNGKANYKNYFLCFRSQNIADDQGYRAIHYNYGVHYTTLYQNKKNYQFFHDNHRFSITALTILMKGVTLHHFAIFWLYFWNWLKTWDQFSLLLVLIGLLQSNVCAEWLQQLRVHHTI